STTDPTTGDTSTTTDGPGDAWLYTEGNHIYTGNGELWRARGANIHDTRSCNACTWGPPDVDEVKRRVDALVDDWGANFMRLTLESYAAAEGRVHWASFADDADYLADIVEIVDYIGTKPDTWVMVSMWVDPSFTDMGWPSAETAARWELLTAAFADDPHVLFGLVNEPQANFNGDLDGQVWTAMNDTVAAIRAAETSAGGGSHIIAVQGTRAWARVLDYYVDHPITAGDGANVAYETHIYNPEEDFDQLLVGPAETLPVIIGEFGPGQGMELSDTAALMDLATSLDVPHLAWTFHMRCAPNLLVDNSGGGCGVDMPLMPTEWGTQLRDRLLAPW
ncbi:MAG: cellulase family glycosylhydrolase, partial [Myxococcales bacterium]|nr:cellulase family glycosylhydrolase [Myxococcales bacterium]